MQLYRYQASARVLIILAIGFLLGFIEQQFFSANGLIAYAFTILIFSWIIGILAAIVFQPKTGFNKESNILDAQSSRQPYRYVALDYSILAACFIFALRMLWLWNG